MIWNPYRIWRAWKDNRRPYLVRKSGHGFRIVWASSLKHCKGKFHKWDCYCLIPHRKTA